MISVITPTIRPEGLEIVAKALRRQTFTDFEWIVGSPKPPNGHKCHWIPDPKKKKGDYWNIYTVYNNLVKKASGKLIVTIQDYTFFNADGLEKFWFHYTQEPKTIVSGVGNKYQDDTWSVKTWQDPRERDDQGTYYQCYYNDIELNFSAFPKDAFYSVGGFDEELNKYSSLCGLDVLDRLNIQGGWDFKLDQTNKSYSLEHGRLPKWEENLPFNGPYEKRRQTYFANPVLEYLK